jgi:hypothetical protein
MPPQQQQQPQMLQTQSPSNMSSPQQYPPNMMYSSQQNYINPNQTPQQPIYSNNTLMTQQQSLIKSPEEVEEQITRHTRYVYIQFYKSKRFC